MDKCEASKWEMTVTSTTAWGQGQPLPNIDFSKPFIAMPDPDNTGAGCYAAPAPDDGDNTGGYWNSGNLRADAMMPLSLSSQEGKKLLVEAVRMFSSSADKSQFHGVWCKVEGHHTKQKTYDHLCFSARGGENGQRGRNRLEADGMYCYENANCKGGKDACRDSQPNPLGDCVQKARVGGVTKCGALNTDLDSCSYDCEIADCDHGSCGNEPESAQCVGTMQRCNQLASEENKGGFCMLDGQCILTKGFECDGSKTLCTKAKGKKGRELLNKDGAYCASDDECKGGDDSSEATLQTDPESDQSFKATVELAGEGITGSGSKGEICSSNPEGGKDNERQFMKCYYRKLHEDNAESPYSFVSHPRLIDFSNKAKFKAAVSNLPFGQSALPPTNFAWKLTGRDALVMRV